jgi:serine/threonine protein kinase
VYSLGNILYHVLTKHQPWTHLEDPPEPELMYVAQQKVEGKLPTLPENYMPKYMELKVIWKATKACFRLDPARRPTALQLAEALQAACNWSQDERIKSKIKDDDIDKLFAIR